ncbi:MAG: hypothetical protein AAGD32_18120 [Planctomycetota bacterium]
MPRMLELTMTQGAEQPDLANGGRVALIATGTTRDRHAETLMHAGYDVYAFDDPYAAMLALCRKPLVFRAVAVSLQAIYPKEMSLISVVGRRYPHMRLIACDTDGRPAALEQARRLGVTDILDAEGPRPVDTQPVEGASSKTHDASRADAVALTEEEAAALAEDAANDTAQGPLLTPEELRALLSDEH